MNPLIIFLGIALVAVPVTGFPAGSNEIEALRNQINQMKQEYERGIQALEDRLQQAEAQAQEAQTHAKNAEASTNAMATAPVVNPPASANAFNAAIGVILDAKARYYSEDISAFQIPGFSVPDEGGLGPEGLSLGESEVNFAANVDDKFYGSLTTALVEENGETFSTDRLARLWSGGTCTVSDTHPLSNTNQFLPAWRDSQGLRFTLAR
jgi:hypothetical protein